MAINTYTGDLGAIEGKISSLTQAVSQGYSGLPGITDALRKSLSEREKTLPGLEAENENKIKELYTADKRLAERYSTPGSEMFIEDPMQRQALISGQKADIRGDLGNILNLIQGRTKVMGNALDKGLEMYKAGLEAQKFELDQATSAWERTFKKQEAGKRGSSGPSNAAMAELVKLLTGAKTFQPTEAKPTGTPYNTEGFSEEEIASMKDVNWHSPEGQWQYNPQSGSWSAAGSQGTQNFNQQLNDLLDTYPELAGTVLGDMEDITGIGKEVSKEDSKQQETQKLITSLPAMGTAGFKAQDLYLQAKSQAKYLSDEEIKEILKAKGWPIY